MTLQHHEVWEVEEFEAGLQKGGHYLYDTTGLPSATQNLTPRQSRWMFNEQLLVMCDAAYALTRYGWVTSEEGVIMRFNFRMAQLLLFNVIADLEECDAAIEIMILKARQLGMTSLVELMIMFRIIFSNGVNAIIASADRQKSKMMGKKLLMGYDMLPIWLRPQYTSRVETENGELTFGQLNSGVYVQHGNQMSGIARGSTPTLYHLCLSGRTLVRVANSQVKPIREVNRADSVLSLSGSLVSVKTKNLSPRRNEVTSEISVWGTPTPLSTTRDHKVLTETGWKEAKDVTSDDWLIYPVRPIADDGSIVMDDFTKWKHLKNGVKDYRPTFELGRLVGLYLAEGIIIRSAQKTPTTVGFCIHRDEDQRVRGWIEEVFGALGRATMLRKTSKTAVVALGHRGFARWLLENVGKRDDKRIPDLAWSLGKDFCRGIVYGYLAGDGSYPPGSNEVYATSIRVAIPIGIRELIASLGHGWSNIAFREEGIWYNRNCRNAWILCVNGDTAVSLRKDFLLPTIESKRVQPPLHWHWTTPAHIAVKVESVADGLSEDFYDIEVDDPNHAFLTPSGIVHNSECASFTNAKEQIEASLFKAVHASPSIFGILESTGEGDEGWWAETWHYSKANWSSRTCRLCPIFFPWVIGRDLYPKPAWLKMRPVPSEFYEHRLPDTKEHVARVEAYIANTPLLSKQLGPRWTMPLEQQWFWEVGHEEHKAKGMEGIWYQEMAGDDIEALQRSQESVFGHDVMVEVEAAASANFQAFGISGQSIEDHHEPPTEDIDYGTTDKPRMREIVTYNSNRGDSYRWELLPLHHDMQYVQSLKTKPDAFREYANGKLMVFYPPTPGIDYSIGVDTSNGMGEDSTVICVTAPASRRGQPDIQVAEFRSAYVSHVEAYAFIMCIAAYYSRFMEDSTPHRNPIVGVEQIASVGDVAQVQMRKMGYTRFPSFIRYDSKDLKKQKSKKIGWYTNVWSRPILVDSFVHSVQNGWYVINSPWLIDECKHFEVHYTASGKEKKEHEEGEHDDGLFAAAISEIIVNDLKSMTERSKKRFGAADQQALPPINVEKYAGQVFSTKPGGGRAITMSDIVYSSTAELDRWR